MKKNVLLYMFITSAFIVSMINFIPVFGHGLAGDMPPPIDLSGKNVTVFVKMNPATLSAAAPEDATIGIRFFDVTTDENLQQVTYRITIKKDGNLLMNDWFYHPNGDLTIKIKPKDTEKIRIYGDKEPQLGGWYGRGGPPVVEAPIFLEGGLYNIYVEIFTVGTTRQILDPPLQFDAWVSVAEDNLFTVVNNDNVYPVIIRSYFDTINKLEFEDDSNMLRFSMPFNWEPEFVEFISMIHEEIIIPKDFKSLVESDTFQAYVNDIPVRDRTLLVDPYSFEDKLVIHYLIATQELINISEQILTDSTYPEEMIFTLKPIEGTQTREGTNMDLITDNGKVRILVSWDQKMIEPDKPVNFDIVFFDENKNSILRDVNYNFKIFDDRGNEIFVKNNILSNEGIDRLTHTFENEGTITLQVYVMGTGSFPSQMDTSFMGIVEGSISVVPEFPIGVIIAMVGAISAVLLLTHNRLMPNHLKV
ncbi:MAG: hypothetical protein EX285_02515 [Thaumarchaeota archaeon]|nr:hypothetical protein [Nitrososphaerota archaeon]